MIRFRNDESLEYGDWIVESYPFNNGQMWEQRWAICQIVDNEIKSVGWERTFADAMQRVRRVAGDEIVEGLKGKSQCNA